MLESPNDCGLKEEEEELLKWAVLQYMKEYHSGFNATEIGPRHPPRQNPDSHRPAAPTMQELRFPVPS
jgi:hypothetical protein